MRIFWATALAVAAGAAGGWATRGHGIPDVRAVAPKTASLEALGGADDLTTDDAGDYHVASSADTFYADNPPSSGAQYEDWAPWRIFDRPVPRGVWVHNLAHGGVVIVYRPDARPEVVGQLRAVYRSLPADARCGHAWALMTPDPELDLEWAMVAWDHVLAAHDVDPDAITRFAVAHRGAHDQRCADGRWSG